VYFNEFKLRCVGKIRFLIDTSGSVWNMLVSFLNAIKALSGYHTANDSLLLSPNRRTRSVFTRVSSTNKIYSIILGFDELGCVAE
jgi:hypothetical protein